MPAAVPQPVRQTLWHLHQRGLDTATIAARLHLAPRTVQRLRRDFGRAQQPRPAGYRPGPGRPTATTASLRQLLVHWRQEHPHWGAPYLRLRLQAAFPDLPWPSSRTLQRWLAAAQLPPAQAGRPPATQYQRAGQPHQTWQLDATDQMSLADGSGVSWLRLVDEASGAFLRTVVFPLATLWPGSRPGRPAGPAADVYPVGSAADVASG